MAKTLASMVHKVRSKNAGPFWLTIDIFCGDKESYTWLAQRLSTERVADCLQQPAASVKRFDIESLNVIKFSLPRPVVQGSLADRDMHGAQWAVLLAELRFGEDDS